MGDWWVADKNNQEEREKALELWECVRENELNREKDDMNVCGCREYDVAVFGGGKIFFSLLRVLIYTSCKPMRYTENFLYIYI